MMKTKYLLTIIFLTVSCQLFAQENRPITDSPIMSERDDKLMLMITSDNWSDLPGQFKSKPVRSRGFSFLLMNEVMSRSGMIGIGGGIGFMSQNVHTDAVIADTTINETTAVLLKIPDSLGYKTNKLSLNFITAAVELRLRTKENEKGHRFKLSTGFLAGVLVQSHTKYEDKFIKNKTYKIKHLEKLQYGVYGRLGYSNYSLYGYFSLADVFKADEGPSLTPTSFGIALTF